MKWAKKKLGEGKYNKGNMKGIVFQWNYKKGQVCEHLKAYHLGQRVWEFKYIDSEVDMQDFDMQVSVGQTKH